jgi:hypothetical protein
VAPFQSALATPTSGVEPDVFITQFNTNGSALLFSTYFGGNAADHGFGIATDPNDNVYVTGRTDSTNFPTTPGAFQRTNGMVTDEADAIIVKIAPEGEPPPPPPPPPPAGGGDVFGSGIVDASALGADRFGGPLVGVFNVDVRTQRNGRARGEVNFTVHGFERRTLRMRSTRITGLGVANGTVGGAGSTGIAGRTAVITGVMRVSGVGLTPFQAVVQDNATPGVPSDRFELFLGVTNTGAGLRPAGGSGFTFLGGRLLFRRDASARLQNDVIVRPSIFSR